MCANSSVVEPILAIAPGAESHPAPRICIDHAVCPSGRHHHLVSGLRENGNTSPGVMFSPLLGIDDCPAGPYLEHFRRRPATVRGYGMNVSLRANRLLAKRASGIHHRAE